VDVDKSRTRLSHEPITKGAEMATTGAMGAAGALANTVEETANPLESQWRDMH
jgi:hypothetical protein